LWFELSAVVVEVSRRKERREREASILVIGATIDGLGLFWFFASFNLLVH